MTNQKDKNQLPSLFEEIYCIAEQDGKSSFEVLIKLMEELGELAEAMLSSTGTRGCIHKGKLITDVVMETVDVIIVAVALLQYAVPEGIKDQTIEGAFELKLAKWKANIAKYPAITPPRDTE